ncbi:MAG: sialate O-acetylesterase, partial [Mucilaginibacter sp.]
MRKSCFIITCFIFLCLQFAAANVKDDFRLADILQSNMVIQQGRPFNLWGRAPAGDTVTIQADWSNKKITKIAGSEKKWFGNIFVPKAIPGKFDEHTITIIHKRDTIRLTNLLIGEVWVCSGQSNMEMSFLVWNKVKNHAAEVAAANYPNIRLLQVEHYASVTPQDEAKGTWLPCTPQSVKDFSAIAYFFAREIYQHKKIPIGLVHTSWGGTVAQAWTSAPAIKQMPYFAGLLEKNRSLPPIDSIPQTLDKVNQPALVYNGMIHPFLNLSVRGVLWYQGESNSNRSYQYRELFPLMINDWRKNWGIGDFPFYFVQLANLQFGTVNDVPKESSWAELQEAQLMTTALPNTGMAVTNDIGNPDDIHYANKQEAGRRLAL